MRWGPSYICCSTWNKPNIHRFGLINNHDWKVVFTPALSSSSIRSHGIISAAWYSTPTKTFLKLQGFYSLRLLICSFVVLLMKVTRDQSDGKIHFFRIESAGKNLPHHSHTSLLSCVVYISFFSQRPCRIISWLYGFIRVFSQERR